MTTNLRIKIKNIHPKRWVTLAPDDIDFEISLINKRGEECLFEYADWYRHFLSTIERAITGDVPKLTLLGCNYSLQWIGQKEIKLFFEDSEKECSIQILFSEFVEEIKMLCDKILKIMDKGTAESDDKHGREEFVNLCNSTFQRYEDWKKQDIK